MLVLVYSEILLILTQDSYMVCTERTLGLKSFWTHPIEHQGDLGHVESHFDPFGDSIDAR
jgi:hypothetical protein